MKYYKSYGSFKDAVTSHLGAFNPGPAGAYINTRTGEVGYYQHILDISENSTQAEVIYNILREDGVEIDLFEKPQQYAHHLNSSQIVCYEFFRPMLNADRTAKEILKRFLTERSISEHKGVLMGRFEYLPNPDEYTNFDFYLEGNDVRVYFEIKYTENGFGKCDKDQTHKDKFETIYKPMIATCGCLSKEPTFDEFCKYYQLFRNVLRVTKQDGIKEYSIFLYPQENTIAEKHFDEFVTEFISGDLASHVVRIHWEECAEYMSETFKNKYFFYL